MCRMSDGQRRLRTISTIIVLLLLQIFNELDWNCFVDAHVPECGDNCRSEHQTEIVCPQDMNDTLDSVRLQTTTPPLPFFLLPALPGKRSPESVRLPLSQRLRTRTPGETPEKPVPQRC